MDDAATDLHSLSILSEQKEATFHSVTDSFRRAASEQNTSPPQSSTFPAKMASNITRMLHPETQTGDEIKDYIRTLVRPALNNFLQQYQENHRSEVEIKLEVWEVWDALKNIKAYLKSGGSFKIGMWRSDSYQNRIEEITDLSYYPQAPEEEINLYFDNYTWEMERPERDLKEEWVEGNRRVRHEELFIPEQPALIWLGRNMSIGIWRISRV